MLNWLRERRPRRAIDLTMPGLLLVQFKRAGLAPQQQGMDDPWILGYVFGAITALLRLYGTDPDGMHPRLYKHGFGAVYGRTGNLAWLKAQESRHLSPFVKAQLIGEGETYDAFSRKRTTPSGLATYLGALNDAEPDSLRQAGERLQAKARARMGPIAFDSAFTELIKRRDA